MKVDIFSEIHTRYKFFTKAEKKVADYILDKAEDVIYMSITDLACASGVGDSSVFRFCKSMDLRGYQEFKIALTHSITPDHRTAHLSSEITREDTIDELSQKILATNVDALNQTYNLLSEEDISDTVESFIYADRVYFYGSGASLLTALEAKNKFMRITNKIDCVIDSHLQAMSAALMTNRDVAVLISYSGSTKDMIELAQIAKERGTKIICITRFIKSPLTSYADITLLCGSNEGPLQGGSISSKLSQLYLLDVLYAEYFRRTEDKSIENKESTAQAVINKLV